MGELRKYTVTVGNNTTVMKLNEKDAKAYGDNAVPVESETGGKSRTVQNKARTASDKAKADGAAGDA